MSDTLPTPRVDAAINKAGEAVANECRKIERELAQMTQERDKARAMVSVAREALTTMLNNQPAQDGGGGLFFPRFDGEGNEIGQEQVDPLAVYGGAMTCAANALARLDEMEKEANE